MEHGQRGFAKGFGPVAPNAGDASFAEDRFARDVAHRHEDIRVCERDVTFQERQHHGDFVWLWIAVLGGAPRHDVCEVNRGGVGAASIHVDSGEHFIKQFARAAYERRSDLVFFTGGGIADDHDACGRIAICEHQIAGTLFQGTQIKGCQRIAQGFKIIAATRQNSGDILGGFLDLGDRGHDVDGFDVAGWACFGDRTRSRFHVLLVSVYGGVANRLVCAEFDLPIKGGKGGEGIHFIWIAGKKTEAKVGCVFSAEGLRKICGFWDVFLTEQEFGTAKMILAGAIVIGFMAPWQWLLRGVAVLAAFMLHLMIFDAQTRCDDWGCDLSIVILIAISVLIGLFLLLRFLTIKYEPALAMYGVGARWLGVGDFVVAAAFGSVLGLLVFIRLIWAFAGANDTVAHLSLLGLVVGAVGVSAAVCVWFGRWWSGGVAGIAVIFMLALLDSLSYPTTVLDAAEKHARGAYCIYFPISDSFYAESGLTLLTMEKSSNAYQNRHAILVWESAGEVRTAFWSFGQERFVRGYEYGVHPVPADMQARFRACLAE